MSVLAVPRSIEMSLEKNPLNHLNIALHAAPRVMVK